ncbi:MAG: threonine synthase [Myxococcota bacterium]
MKIPTSPSGEPYRAWFECFGGCPGHWPLTEVLYACPSCGGLLTVRHDLRLLRQTSADTWKALFRRREHDTEYPLGSGVWGKWELVCPAVEDGDAVVSMYEGNSNLFWARRYGEQLGLADLWLKLCGVTHTGSFKDLGMTVLVSVVNQMRKDGKQIPAVACASTGDTSAALAAYAAYAGIPAIVLLPRNKVSLAQLVQPIANGAITLALETDFDGCMEIVRRISERDGIYLANSMNSLRIEGQKTVGMEIVEQFDWEVPDWIIIPGGNLGNVSALGKGLLEFQELGIIDRLPRIVCAQAERANPLYRAYQSGFERFEPIEAQPTVANAIRIGNPVSYAKAVETLQRFDGIVEQASEQELATAAAEADRTGLLNCPHTGVALAVLKKLLERGEIRRDERVVVISTAHGLKFTDFKAAYHQDRLPDIHATLANREIALEASYERVRDEIFRQIDKRFG